MTLIPRLASDRELSWRRGLNYKSQRMWALTDLIPYLTTPDQRERALTMARGFANLVFRARTLKALGRPDEAHETARAIEDLLVRVRTLAELDRVEEALEVARSIKDERERVCAWLNLESHLTEPAQVEEALAMTETIGSDWDRDHILERLAPRLASPDRELAVIRKIRDDETRARATASLAPRPGGDRSGGGSDGVGQEIRNKQQRNVAQAGSYFTCWPLASS